MAEELRAEDVILISPRSPPSILPGWTPERAQGYFEVDDDEDLTIPFQPFTDLQCLALTVLLVLVQDVYNLSNQYIMATTGIKEGAFFRVKGHVLEPGNPKRILPGGEAIRPAMISDEIFQEVYDEYD
jgi:hypothetical protein